MPDSFKWLNKGYVARVWAFLKFNQGRWYTPEEIARETKLKISTVRDALSRISKWPRIQQRRFNDEVKCRFQPVIVLFPVEENE